MYSSLLSFRFRILLRAIAILAFVLPSVAAIAQGSSLPANPSSTDIRLPGRFCSIRSTARATECHDRASVLFALVRNDIREAERLLEQSNYESATVNSISLGFAMLAGRPETLQFLLRLPRLDPNVPTMVRAEIFDRIDLTSRLLEHLRTTTPNLGIDVDDPDLSLPPLHMAVILNRPDFFYAVLRHPEIRPDQVDRLGNTVWHWIARYQRPAFAQLLLQSQNPHRPKIDVRNKLGFTAMQLMLDDEGQRVRENSERVQLLKIFEDIASSSGWLGSHQLQDRFAVSAGSGSQMTTAVLGRTDPYSGANATIPSNTGGGGNSAGLPVVAIIPSGVQRR